MKGVYKMKKRIISSIILLALIVTAGLVFNYNTTKASNERSADPDAICVYLNGTPVSGAVVNIGNVQQVTTTTGGCVGVNYDSGSYCITASYGTYKGCTYFTFTSSPDQVNINLGSGQCSNCPDR